MKPGVESQTAVMVCLARAVAHERWPGSRFRDPTAATLLPEDARAKLERFRSGAPPRNLRERLERLTLDRRAAMMAARTVAIDDAIREATSPQVVILGAGLDGRAWRMPELADVTVFEVDHPDSQRQKRARAARLPSSPSAAKDLRFVAVDFARDDLGEALASAGHDASRPTTWIWEGVVMYLTRPQIEATLAVVAARSTPRSRLVVAYHHPALLLHLFGFVLRRVGEPLRSAFTSDEMRAMLGAHGFTVVRDEDIPTLAARMPRDLAGGAGAAKHLRIVTADRVEGRT